MYWWTMNHVIIGLHNGLLSVQHQAVFYLHNDNDDDDDDDDDDHYDDDDNNNNVTVIKC